MSIRKFKKDKLGIDDLVNFGAFSEEMAAYLAGRRGDASEHHRVGRYRLG